MTAEEFSDQFDVLYNNITSNQAPGLNEYEKSVVLTKAQNEIVKNYFTPNSPGNVIQQGFDDSAKRQADFSCLMKTASCGIGSNITTTQTTVNTYICTIGNNKTVVYGLSFSDSVGEGTYSVTGTADKVITANGKTVKVTGLPEGTTSLEVIVNNINTSTSKIDRRSTICTFPNDVFISINETIRTGKGRDLQVVPLRYDEYLRLMSKPYKRPLKYQAWRLINTGAVNGSLSDKVVEIIVGAGDSIASYDIRYIRFPKPIIVGPLDNLTINGLNETQWMGCELDPIIHEDILQRAVELAKVAWTATGQDNFQAVLEAGKRSE